MEYILCLLFLLGGSRILESIRTNTPFLTGGGGIRLLIRPERRLDWKGKTRHDGNIAKHRRGRGWSEGYPGFRLGLEVPPGRL
jgi:hypothetical protein